MTKSTEICYSYKTSYMVGIGSNKKRKGESILKKIIGVLCSLVLLLACILPVNFAFAEENNEELVRVILYSDEEQVIISEVPKFYEQEYLAQLENPEFRSSEIQNSSGITELNRATSPSRVSYMTKSDILKVVDHMDASFNWQYYISNPLTDTLIAKAVAVLTKNNFVGAALGVLAWAAADLANRQEAWWKESAIMVLRGQITGVKQTVTPGPASGYPAAYIITTRY